MEFHASSPSRPLHSSKTVNICNSNGSATGSAKSKTCTLEDDLNDTVKTSNRNFLLEVQFQELRQKITPLFNVLGKTVPGNQLEKMLMDKSEDVDDVFVVTTAAIKEAENLLTALSAQVNEKERTSQHLWTEVKELWEELESKEERQLTFTNAHIGIVEALKFLKMEYLKRKKEKGERITLYILDLRSELVEIWKQCLISDEEKSEFTAFYSMAFTEELLDLHKEELRKWKIYHEKNQVVLDKMKQRREMWIRLRELEMRSDDPARFVNRGGTLLKDQKDLTTIMKSLPKLENELRKLADQFEIDHGRKVTIYGQDIPTLIDQEWEKFNEEKQTKKLGCRSKIRQSIMPPPAPKLPEKRAASKPSLTPTPKRKCAN